MNKKILSFSLLLSTLVLASCGSNGNAQRFNQKPVTGLNIAAGGFMSDENTYISEQGGSLAYANEELRNGYIEVNVTNPQAADSGIVFCLTNPERKTTFWEVEVAYYFFFVNLAGDAYLGKVNYGTWSALETVHLNNWTETGTYKLKVELNTTTANLYVNDKLYISYSEHNFLEGRQYGIRAGIENAIFEELVVEY